MPTTSLTFQHNNSHPTLNQLQHIVAVGGGHGLGRVMSALNFLQERLTGIVTTTDNGGSTGRIRAEQGGIAWGDLRNCLNQIITQPSTASALFEYRFTGEGELAGHNLGNLMLKALENIRVRPLEAVNLIRELLQVKPKIIPMSEDPVHLTATLTCGSQIVGEVNIDQLNTLPKELALTPQVPATPESIIAIQQAEVILFGPGSFLTSIMPPLLLTEVKNALKESTAKKIFIDNLGVEHSPAANLSLSQRVNWINRQVGADIIDAVLTQPNPEITPSLTATVFARKLNADDISYRHDRERLSQALDQILNELISHN